MDKKPYYWSAQGMPTLVIEHPNGAASELIIVHTSENRYYVRGDHFDDIDSAMDYAEQLADEIIERRNQRKSKKQELQSMMDERNRKLGRACKE